ncbi:MAG TPA: ABC transporter substrate-binding protein [Solirubrobacteraceae bacterium]|nr:ABC transporter substrate-binding protein [Solirubrobacteraceae bacterium]
MFVAACGDDDESGGGGGGGGGGSSAASTGATDGVGKAPTLAESEDATGEVTYCLGKDTAGNNTAVVKEFNAEFGGSGLTGKLLEFPESADEQRNQFVQRQEAKSGECDVFRSDVIWTAEFASQKWLLDMSEYVDTRKDEFIPATLETINYEGAYYGVPQATDSAFIYYRDDKVSSVPETWQELYTEAEANGGIVYQGASYEGLTCDYLELAFAAGGEVLSEDGKESVINSPENLKALEFMVDGVKSGVAPKAVTTYMEEESRRSFESGGPAFMRNWPYAYALGNQKGSKVAGKFKVAPFPAFEGGGKAGILGGHNLVISASSKNPKGAVKLIDYLTSAEAEKTYAAEYSIAPVLDATYDDPDVQKALPFSEELRQAVTQAKSRPVSPVYPQISQAIYKNVNKALAGQTSPEDALKAADDQINEALSTF